MLQNLFGLAGKRVVVVGGTSGVGFAVAEAARSLGASVVVASSDIAKVEATIERLPGVAGDVVDLKQEASMAAFLDRQPPFDHLAITAGDKDARRFGSTEDLTLAVAREAFEARVFGAFSLIKHGRRKVAPGGSVVLTSGVLARRPRKGSPFPTVTMGAVEQLVRGFAVDLAPLRINAVRLGLVLPDNAQAQGRERAAAFTAGLPLPRAATPGEAALAYIYLMLSAYTTGLILPVDGGGSLV